MRWFTWLTGGLGVLFLIAACSTTEPGDSKDRPRAQVIGYGTTPGSSWAGVGVAIPFPGKSANAPPSAESGSEEPPADRKQ